MVKSIDEISLLPNPVNEVINEYRNPEGLVVKKVRVPLGVILIIYESRPNVTIEATALCLKSGNAVILRGGKEAINSNAILVEIVKKSLNETGVDENAVGFIDSPDRDLLYEILRQPEFIDLVIARGGEQMIKTIMEKSSVPVLAHGKGLCHTYVDKSADLKIALDVTFNAKVQRPGVCNAMETLLVHKGIANKFLPEIGKLYSEAGVKMKGCQKTREIIECEEATELDWETEYLDLTISIKIVNSLAEAIQHINRYGSKHSDAIISEDENAIKEFINKVDSSAVFVNSSTRLHDGGVFGLGAEIGISTQKIHARGTMGLRELTTTKYIIYGRGHIRK
jgi:glutamate-5-semialdehyde dehydrogenase